jgi:hypothetical protein
VVIHNQVQSVVTVVTWTTWAQTKCPWRCPGKAEQDGGYGEQECSAGRNEQAQTAQLLTEADEQGRDRERDASEENQHPEALREEAGIKYDSAERHQEFAASLEGIADPEAVQARLSADQDQGTPPTEAVTVGPGPNPKGRQTHGANGQTTLLQKDMSR